MRFREASAACAPVTARYLIAPFTALIAAAAPGWAGMVFPLKPRIDRRNAMLAPASADPAVFL